MILYRYIIKEHIFPFLASLSIIVFYFIMQQAVMLLERIVSKGLDGKIVLEVFIIQLGWIIALAIPMAILTATLWVFGRMSGDNEITSIKASGQSMLTLLSPVFAAAAVVTVLLVFFMDLILPDANHRAANLLSDISRKRPAAFIDLYNGCQPKIRRAQRDPYIQRPARTGSLFHGRGKWNHPHDSGPGVSGTHAF
jgi:lipopolysaccharide export system permease protein